MAQPYTVKVIDQSRVAPPPGSVSTTTIPLTFFDMTWLFCPPMQRIFFYEFPYPTLYFTQNIIPKLKQSLSLTLRHVFPLAANLTCPPPPNKPYILYNEGDSVLVTVAESAFSFNYLIANQARDNTAFQSLVPKLPMTSLSSDKTHVVPIMAMQVTVFPNIGLSIGITFNHVAADGRSFNHFVKLWASIHRSGGEDSTCLSLPYHNKDLIKDPDEVASIFLNDLWCHAKNPGSNETLVSVPQDNVRVTLVLRRAQIDKLKERFITHFSGDNGQGPIRISTYAVTCAFMWVSLMRLQESKTIGELKEDTLYHFAALADCRERFSELPIPAAYFGNCLACFWASAKRNELMEENGIVVAAKAISTAVCGMEKGPLVGAEKWIKNWLEMLKFPGRLVTVAGSPKLRVYETDFGWGRPKKSEVGHIGAYGSFSLNECREEEGGIEIGFVLGRDKLDLFNAILDKARVDVEYPINIGEVL